MHYAWSTIGNLTLYLAHTTKKYCNCNSSTFNNNYPDEGSITIPGMESSFSLAVVFTRIIEFNATKNNLAAKALNLSVVCNEDLFESNRSYSRLPLDDSKLKWEFVPENSTFVGSYYTNDTVFENRTRFSIRVSL